jgi:hypothetical protein
MVLEIAEAMALAQHQAGAIRLIQSVLAEGFTAKSNSNKASS